MYCGILHSLKTCINLTGQERSWSRKGSVRLTQAPTPSYPPPSMESLNLTHVSWSQTSLCQAAFLFNEEHWQTQRITPRPYELPVLRTQRLLCSSDRPCSDAYLKIRQTLNSALPPEGTAASSFQTASSVLQGTGSLVSAPIQILKWKECKWRGQKRGEEGGRAGEGAETLKGNRWGLGKGKIWAQTLERGE